eukprot:Seg14450.1 transcript_id=Seg14450.1/GoldUCD/mRNA.D3Y31 product="hypothetical protein" protein_id=Seg14450.1/GoldUCD/D3Y31
MQYTVQVGIARVGTIRNQHGEPQGDFGAMSSEFTFTLAVALRLQNPDAITLPQTGQSKSHNQDKENFSIWIFKYRPDGILQYKDKKTRTTDKKNSFESKRKNLNINTEKNRRIYFVGQSGNDAMVNAEYL